jgi:hypothetical protein
MKKTILLFLIASTFYHQANCQITKGNWMVGGNARIETQQEKLNQSDITSWAIKLSPDIGYFFIDKFAGGLKPTLNYSIRKFSGTRNEATILAIGPFIRYYFLPAENQVNIFAESAYQYQTDFKEFRSNDFTLSAGPVIYFNSSVGLELTLNYEQYDSKSSNTSAKTFSFGIGFQIHLEKQRKL